MNNDLVIKVETNIASCNIDLFSKQAEQYLAQLHNKFETDEDFAIVKSEVKNLKELEDRTRDAIESVLNGSADVAKIIDEAKAIAESFRVERLSRDKLVKEKEQEIKADIMNGAFAEARNAIKQQPDIIQQCLIKDFSDAEIKGRLIEAIKNKRTLNSLQASVNAEKNLFIAEVTAEIVRINERLRLIPKDSDHLFKDVVQLVSGGSSNKELQAEIDRRIADEKARQEEIKAQAEFKAQQAAQQAALQAQQEAAKPEAKPEPKEEPKQEQEAKQEPRPETKQAAQEDDGEVFDFVLQIPFRGTVSQAREYFAPVKAAGFENVKLTKLR